MNDTPDVLTSQQAARLMGLSTTTVQKMVANGELEAWVTSGGHRRIFRSAVEKMMPNRVGLNDTAARRALRVLLAEDDDMQVAQGSWFLAKMNACKKQGPKLKSYPQRCCRDIIGRRVTQQTQLSKDVNIPFSPLSP